MNPDGDNSSECESSDCETMCAIGPSEVPKKDHHTTEVAGEIKIKEGNKAPMRVLSDTGTAVTIVPSEHAAKGASRFDEWTASGDQYRKNGRDL